MAHWSDDRGPGTFPIMGSSPARFYFDFCDPLSYLWERALSEVAPGTRPVERVGVELRPPPAPLTTVGDPLWAARWERAGELGLSRPDASRLVPWTRKAHELHLLAREHACDDGVRRALFEAYFEAGRDVGRVDVLVDIAAAFGIDRTEAKAALDVDRLEGAVRTAAERAADLGVTDVPTLVVDGSPVRDFHNPSALGTLLGAP